MNGSHIKYKLGPGSQLLRVAYWQLATQFELKSLIQRFATREHNNFMKAKPSFLWRRKRLGAVRIYEARFEPVPELFRTYKLSRKKSYYVENGNYIWSLTHKTNG